MADYPGIPVKHDEAFALRYWLDGRYPGYTILTDTADDGTLMLMGLHALEDMMPVQENMDLLQTMWDDLIRVLATIREKK